MAANEQDRIVVAEGTFLYDGAVAMRIQIVGENFDYYYEISQPDELEPGQRPAALGENGLLYRVLPGGSPAFQTVKAAMEWADQQPWGPVTWASSEAP